MLRVSPYDRRTASDRLTALPFLDFSRLRLAECGITQTGPNTTFQLAAVAEAREASKLKSSVRAGQLCHSRSY
jgi:hypothetical protein